MVPLPEPTNPKSVTPQKIEHSPIMGTPVLGGINFSDIFQIAPKHTFVASLAMLRVKSWPRPSSSQGYTGHFGVWGSLRTPQTSEPLVWHWSHWPGRLVNRGRKCLFSKGSNPVGQGLRLGFENDFHAIVGEAWCKVLALSRSKSSGA